tara:strand:+ start:610 stop:918 length:309 start_codon:yes stop_codon:yes gene_type:complete
MRHRSKSKTESILRRCYNRAECQARFRNEEWQVSWDHWYMSWMYNDNYLNKGRSNTSLIFARKDLSLPWSDSNSEIVVRLDYLRKSAKRECFWKYRKTLQKQ